jgi:hypothetical protein
MMKNSIDFLEIQDAEKNLFVGANQYWFKNKFHAISGCGPTTAAEILTYIAFKNKPALSHLYDYDINHLYKEDFVAYMTSVREFVKPGIKGLTDIDYFNHQLISFAKGKGVALSSKIIMANEDKTRAFEEIKTAIDAGYPLAMLILRNPHDEIDEYTWHWMNIIGYDQSSLSIQISTYGKTHRLDFNKVWVSNPKYISEFVWFKPAGL